MEWKGYTSKNTQSMTRLSAIEGAYADNDWKQVSEHKCERVGECPVHDCANLASKIVGSPSVYELFVCTEVVFERMNQSLI